MPAANAPRITSSPNSEASTTSATIRSSERRTASWPLVPIVVSIRRTTRAGRARSARKLAPTTTAAKTKSRVVRNGSPASTARMIETITTGPNSPIAPAPTT